MVVGGIQAQNAVLWQTPVDLQPPYSGTDLLIHYGSPLIAGGGTVVIPVRTGPNSTWPTVGDTYQIEGRSAGTGSLVYTISTDFTDWMPHDWTPDLSPAIDYKDRLYIPAAGGTVLQVSNADSPNATVTRLSFYGLNQYNENSIAYNANVQICTPITVDTQNNVYFGFYVASGFGAGQGNASGLMSGIARISSTGVGTWVSADSVAGTTGNEVATNSALAVSNNGQDVYAAVKQAGVNNYDNPELLELNSTTLSAVGVAALAGPTASNGDTVFAYILDDGTASPTIGPDGDVYFGIWYSIIARGFMLHYSGDLTVTKTPGAFGWDDTSAIVPASAVPGYTGTSKYLILTKYNNYGDAGVGGNGENEIALLDPNSTEIWSAQYDPTYTGTEDTDQFVTMNEVQTLLGLTLNTAENLPGVREWCINMAAIDVTGKSAVVNSEDGHSYRWNFATGTVTGNLNLEPPTGEAYTMTISGPDGLSYAINNATLFAMWDGAQPTSLTSVDQTIIGGNHTDCTLELSTAATGPGATIQLTSSNPNVTVPATVRLPAGQSSITFGVNSVPVDGDESATITATRYGKSVSTQLTLSSSALFALTLSPAVLYGGQSGNGILYLSGASPSTGRGVTLSCTVPSITLSTKSFRISGGKDSATFTYTAKPANADEVGQIVATLDDGSTISTSVTDHGPLLTGLSLSPTVVVGGQAVKLTVSTQYSIPAGGVEVAMDYSAHSYGPGVIEVGPGSDSSVIIHTTPAPGGSYPEKITASLDGVTKTAEIVVVPQASLSKLSLSGGSVYMTGGVTGTVALASAATANTEVGVTSSDSDLIVSYNPVVLKGQATAQFKVVAAALSTDADHVSTLTASLGDKSLTATVVIEPIVVTKFGITSATLHAGQSATLAISTSHAASNFDLAVALKSSSATLLKVPADAMVPTGAAYTTVTVKAASTVVGTNKVTISATLGGRTVTEVVTVEP